MKKLGKVLAASVVAVVLAGCYPTVKAGQACKTGDPRGSDGKYVLDCINGKYTRVKTLAAVDIENHTAHHVEIVSGANQTTGPLTKFAQTLVVKVVGPTGIAIPGARVEFTSPKNLLWFGPWFGTSDSTGLVKVSANAGQRAGTEDVAVKVVVSGVVTKLKLVVKAGAPVTVLRNSGNAQAAPVNRPFPFGLAIGVLDAYGNPVPNVAVTYTAHPSAEGASITVATKKLATNASGLVSYVPIANGIEGIHRVTASVAGQVVEFNLQNDPAL